MPSFNLETFDPNKNYVIEASAGTGKTFNIKGIVNKLVKQHHVDLNKILIVTYTDKAAGELRNRIREELNGKGNEYDIDKASIGTIHSFCQSVIGEFGISANLPSGLKMVDEEELKNFVSRFIREGDVLKELTVFMAADPNFKPETVEKRFVEAISKYYLDSDFKEDKKIISLYDSDNVDDKVMEYYSKVSDGTISNLDDAKRELPDFSKNYYCLAKSSQSKAKKVLDGIIISAGKKIDFSGVRAPGVKNWADEEKRAFYYFDNLKNADFGNHILNKYLAKLYKAWQIEKNTNRVQNFDDMIRNVREAVINDDNLKNKLKEKYTYAIIDEFQDTNQKQFDIFEAVFMEDDNHHIIVVGDPKQSIYSFQGADIDVYKNAVKTIVDNGGEKCVLGNNFRSSEDMVLTCNELFKHYGFTEPEFQSVEPKTRVTNTDIATVKYDDMPVEAFWLAVDCLYDRELMAIDSSTSDFAKVAVEQILDCCSIKNGKTKLQLFIDEKARDVSFRDFTVLARTSSEMKEIQSELKLSGIPFIRYKDASLYKGRECAHWIALLQAINTPDFTGSNRAAFKKALFTGFFGKSLQQISDSKYDKDDSAEMVQINEWKQLAISRNWEGLIDDILLKSNLRYTMKSLREIQSYSIYRQIGEFCVDYLSNKQSVDSLIKKLEELADNGKAEDGDGSDGIVEKGTDFDCVQIMTIHASKGLEFPVVIAPCGFKKLKTVNIFKYKNEQKESLLSFAKINEEGYSRPEISELKDLFYVAYTRAKYVMILPYYEKYGGTATSELKFLKKSLDNMIDNHGDMLRFITLSNDYSVGKNRQMVREILNKNNVFKNDDERQKQEEVLKQLSKNKSGIAYKHSYSSLSHGNHGNENEIVIAMDETRDKEGNQILGLADFDKKGIVVDCTYDNSLQPLNWPAGFPKGAAIGTALHEIFEKLDYVSQDNLEKIIRRSFINAGLAFKDEWLEPVKEMVDRVLHAKLPVVKGSVTNGEFLQLCTVNEKLAECEFIFNKEDEFLKNYFNGFIDLIFKNGDYYSIVDWKSDSLSDDFTSYSDAAELKNHVDSCYSIQRTLYAYCLVKWLKSFNPEMSEQQVFEQHFGGVYYVFMRGCNNNASNGIYCHNWSKWADIEASFKEIVKERLGGK